MIKMNFQIESLAQSSKNREQIEKIQKFDLN